MSLDIAAPRVVGVGFAQDLRTHGERLALVGPRGERITYLELAERVDARVADLGLGRKLVLLAGANDVEPLVTYLAALAAGHPVLLADPANVDALAAAFDPDVVAHAGLVDVRRAESAHELHPDLALLLSTSGSTGSGKLVRLSAENVQANAAAIAEYLGIRPTDRAPTSLPMQYCYGLSVINSNLLSGAGLLLTGGSVIDERFWSTMREHGGTSLHGVPYTFELLERAGFAERELPSLRYVTQAGGRLDPDRVRAFAELGERRGWRFFVMYGQTEATARMAYLPPELAATRPEAVGVPIPGGSFSVAGDGSGDAVGEMLYRGPNVMLGYATRAADLALGRTVDVLATGDIARRAADGLWEIVGRASRFVKLCGLRIDLDQLERLLADHGVTAACTGDDDTLLIGYTGGRSADAVQHLVCERLGVPADRVLVSHMPELPRTAAGKLDYPAVRAAVGAGARREDAPKDAFSASGAAKDAFGAVDALKASFSAHRRRRSATVREIYARVLHVDEVQPDDTFVSLGGDSLRYVQASLQLERAVGELPAAWPTTPVRELERLASNQCVVRSTTLHKRRIGSGRPRRGFAAVETNILLRAVAIVLVVATHMSLFHFLGGAHLLLVLAGWSFARFCVPRGDDTGNPSRRILRSAVRVAIPSMLWIAWRTTSQADTGVANALLVGGYAGRPWTMAYWFVEVLVHILLAASLLYAVPAVRQLDRQHPLAVPLLVLAAGFAVRLATLEPPGQVHWWFTHQVLWCFALGWLAQRSSTWRHKLFVLVAAALMLPSYFLDPTRIGIVLVGLALVLFLPHVRLPWLLARAVGVVAGASLYIYLTHYALVPQATIHFGPFAATLISLGLGVAAWLAVEFATRRVRSWRPGRSPASSPSTA